MRFCKPSASIASRLCGFLWSDWARDLEAVAVGMAVERQGPNRRSGGERISKIVNRLGMGAR